MHICYEFFYVAKFIGIRGFQTGLQISFALLMLFPIRNLLNKKFRDRFIALITIINIFSHIIFFSLKGSAIKASFL